MARVQANWGKIYDNERARERNNPSPRSWSFNPQQQSQDDEGILDFVGSGLAGGTGSGLDTLRNYIRDHTRPNDVSPTDWEKQFRENHDWISSIGDYGREVRDRNTRNYDHLSA